MIVLALISIVVGVVLLYRYPTTMSIDLLGALLIVVPALYLFVRVAVMAGAMN